MVFEDLLFWRRIGLNISNTQTICLKSWAFAKLAFWKTVSSRPLFDNQFLKTARIQHVSKSWFWVYKISICSSIRLALGSYSWEERSYGLAPGIGSPKFWDRVTYRLCPVPRAWDHYLLILLVALILVSIVVSIIWYFSFSLSDVHRDPGDTSGKREALPYGLRVCL